MNFKEIGIKSIKPIAQLEGGLDGVRLIAEIEKDNETKTVLLLPPTYDIKNATPLEQYFLEAAIAKYGYVPITEKPIITFEQYEEYLKKINKIQEK